MFWASISWVETNCRELWSLSWASCAGETGWLACARRVISAADGIDFVTANGENLAGGIGLTVSTAEALLGAGVDVITSGNHIWDKREIYPYLETSDRVLRPLNYGTHEVPGRGWGTYQALDGTDLAVIGDAAEQLVDPGVGGAARTAFQATSPAGTRRTRPSCSRTSAQAPARFCTVAIRAEGARRLRFQADQKTGRIKQR